ncbi:MAG: tRNA (adenosine(37)-N6)-threonylcarbamoyltransferase complex dimerization subunit type 1 TsaB [Gammaproteobacteria bacterium]
MAIIILAFDTSSDACSVALRIGKVALTRHVIAKQKQSELVLNMLNKLLKEADLKLEECSALTFGQGPGSFTGIRLAASIAQGLSFGSNLPVIPVSTLQILAQGTYREYQEKNVLVANDARMQEIYFGAYSLDVENIMQPLFVDSVGKTDNPPIQNNMLKTNWIGIGSAWEAYQETLAAKYQEKNLQLKIHPEARYPNALDLVNIAMHKYAKGEKGSRENILPVYCNSPAYKKNKN